MRTTPIVNLVRAVAIAVSSFSVYAVGPGSYDSDLKGVALWELNGSEFWPVDKNDTFVKHCDGKNKIYILERDSMAFTCQSKSIANEFFQNDFAIVMTDGANLSGLYIISTHPLKPGHFQFESLSESDTKKGREIANQRLVAKLPSDAVSLGHAIELFERNEKKISIGTREVLIVPTAYLGGGDDPSADIMSYVIVKENGSFRHIGEIHGCLSRLADIDSDGVPEVLTETCQTTESASYTYWKIYPVVKSLVRYTTG